VNDDLEGVSPADYRRNFTAGLVHGVFFQASSAFVSLNSVLPAFLTTLTPSTLIVGALAAAQRIGQVLPQLFTAFLIEDRPRKKPYLLAIITFRWLSWAALAALTLTLATDHPAIVLAVLLGLFTLFSIAGGIGTVIYADIFAKAIPTRRRGRFIGWRQLLGYALAIAAGAVVARILGNPERFPYPTNFGLIFALAAGSLLVAFVGFTLIREPAAPVTRRSPRFGALLRRSLVLTRRNRNFRLLLASRAATESVVAITPFFTVYALRDVGVGGAAIGGFVAAEMAGAAGSNLLWGWLGDHVGNKAAILGAATAALLAPVVALLAPAAPALLLVTFALAGAAASGIRLGYVNLILEMASPALRPTCVALQNTLLAPLAFLPLIVGGFADVIVFPPILVAAAALMAVGLLVSLRVTDPRHDPAGACIE